MTQHQCSVILGPVAKDETFVGQTSTNAQPVESEEPMKSFVMLTLLSAFTGNLCVK